jgi:hypothetical protein
VKGKRQKHNSLQNYNYTINVAAHSSRSLDNTATIMHTAGRTKIIRYAVKHISLMLKILSSALDQSGSVTLQLQKPDVWSSHLTDKIPLLYLQITEMYTTSGL